MSNKKKPSQTFKMRADHTWRCKPGYTIFVADRGAVRFDFPKDWIIEHGPDAIKIVDMPPPDHTCSLSLSVFYLPVGVDWSELPVDQLLRDATSADTEHVLTRGDVHYEQRPDLELAWRESRFMDPEEQRPSYSRSCTARARNVQPLITLDYWPEDRDRLIPVWDEVLRTLRVGEYIKDPTRGPGY